ncbi:MAG: hypothetical protein J6P47_04665 [Acetobacter sp.]|nr:hypothetical protein [Acetobacter sp.]
MKIAHAWRAGGRPPHTPFLLLKAKNKTELKTNTPLKPHQTRQEWLLGGYGYLYRGEGIYRVYGRFLAVMGNILFVLCFTSKITKNFLP